MKKTSIIPNGKYKGKTVEEVLNIDPEYFFQRHRKLYFEESILEEAQEIIDEQEHIQNDKDYEYKRLFRETDT